MIILIANAVANFYNLKFCYHAMISHGPIYYSVDNIIILLIY